jgi:hypothetical protein
VPKAGLANMRRWCKHIGYSIACIRS